MTKQEYLTFVRKEFQDLIKECKEKGISVNDNVFEKYLNIYERNLLLYYASTKYLLDKIDCYSLNSMSEFREFNKYCLTYSFDDFIKHHYIHLLLKRLKEAK